MTMPTAADLERKCAIYELNAMTLGNMAAIWLTSKTSADEERQLRLLRLLAYDLIRSMTDYREAVEAVHSATGGINND